MAGPITALLLAVSSYLQISKYVLRYAEKNSLDELEKCGQEIDSNFRDITTHAESLGTVIASEYAFPNHLQLIDRQIKESVRQYPGYLGIWYVGDSKYKNQGSISNWYHLEHGTPRFIPSTVDDSSEKYAKDSQYAYFWGPKKTGKTYYTEPYADPTIGIMMTSVCAPIYDSQHNFIGVVGIDVWRKYKS